MPLETWRDPHGTHKICLDILFDAISEIKNKSFMKDCWLWLYRGAWQEWDIHEIDMAVPMSPEQVIQKRNSILSHQSQKDKVMYQGQDKRDFLAKSRGAKSKYCNNIQQIRLD